VEDTAQLSAVGGSGVGFKVRRFRSTEGSRAGFALSEREFASIESLRAECLEWLRSTVVEDRQSRKQRGENRGADQKR